MSDITQILNADGYLVACFKFHELIMTISVKFN